MSQNNDDAVDLADTVNPSELSSGDHSKVLSSLEPLIMHDPDAGGDNEDREVAGYVGGDMSDIDDDDEDIDETLSERLIGLTEMFPDVIRNSFSSLFGFSWQSSKWLYNVGRIGLWVVASSATILALPVLFESERNQMEEQQMLQQRQVLLGPNAAMSGSLSGGLQPGMPVAVQPAASQA